MSVKIKYTEEQTQELIDLYQNQRVPVSRIVAMGKFPGKQTTIQKYINSLGLEPIVHKCSITDFEQDIVLPWKQGESLGKLSKKFNTTKEALSSQLKKLGYEVINKQTTIKFDDSIFDSIDTEEKAYWLGFIYADGNIKTTTKTTYRLTINLEIGDYKHLEKFNIFTKHSNFNVKTVKHGQECSWYACSKHLWEILNSYGCTPCKSLTLKFPDESIFKESAKYTKKELIRHFIRGYFDGDGCISYNRYKKELAIRCSVLGTYDFISKLKIWAELPDALIQERSTKNTYYNLKLDQTESIKFAKYLYENANIYLDRKYNRFQAFKNNNFKIPYSSKSIKIFDI